MLSLEMALHFVQLPVRGTHLPCSTPAGRLSHVGACVRRAVPRDAEQQRQCRRPAQGSFGVWAVRSKVL